MSAKKANRLIKNIAEIADCQQINMLSIDFGTKKIGIACANTTTKIASPLAVIDNDKYKFQKIIELIKEREIRLIVIGYPYDMDGKEPIICQKVRAFSRNLCDSYDDDMNVSHIFHDERLTSYTARYYVSDNYSKGKKIIDKIAANVILEDFIYRCC